MRCSMTGRRAVLRALASAGDDRHHPEGVVAAAMKTPRTARCGSPHRRSVDSQFRNLSATSRELGYIQARPCSSKYGDARGRIVEVMWFTHVHSQPASTATSNIVSARCVWGPPGVTHWTRVRSRPQCRRPMHRRRSIDHPRTEQVGRVYRRVACVSPAGMVTLAAQGAVAQLKRLPGSRSCLPLAAVHAGDRRLISGCCRQQASSSRLQTPQPTARWRAAAALTGRAAWPCPPDARLRRA